MARPVEVLCLANSTKHGGRCIAGLRLDTGGWIRPIPGTENNELHPRHFRTADGHEPEPLDSLRIFVDKHQPECHQPENWLLSDEPWELIASGWTKRAVIAINAAIELDGEIFGTSGDSIERATLAESPAVSSLSLLLPNQVEFYRDERKEQQRAAFEFGGTAYDLPVTDPEWCEKIRSQEFKRMPATAHIDEGMRLVFTISLGEPFEGRCYKLVAAVFTMPSDVIIGI